MAQLTKSQIDHFIDHGWVAVPDCFTRAQAQEKVDRWIEEQGFAGKDPMDWGHAMMHRGLKDRFNASEFSPKAYAVAEELVGAGRIENWTWGGFIVNVRFKRDQPWKMPGPDEGWHVDGDFFHHFLDSREQSLLTVQVFTDMKSRGGCTVIADGSYKPIARMLREHPAGLDPGAVCREAKKTFTFAECPPIEVEQPTGTVVFLHPLMWHASSPNTDGPPRFMMNAVPIIKDHFRFDRLEGACLVERATIAACGGQPFAFTIEGERKWFKPDRNTYEKK